MMPACPLRLATRADWRRSQASRHTSEPCGREGSDGHVWIGTPGGLIEFDGRVFRVYSERYGLSNEAINAVAEDRAGNAGGRQPANRRPWLALSLAVGVALLLVATGALLARRRASSRQTTFVS